MELVRQPIFLLLMTGSVLFEMFLAVPYYFAFGDEIKLVANSALAVMLLSGLFGAVLSASSSLAREIRGGTVLAVLSKPVGRTQFLLAKYAGLAGALTVLSYVNMVGVLLASKMAFDAYGSTDVTAIAIFSGGHKVAFFLQKERQGRNAVKLGHVDVEHDHVGVAVRDLRDRLASGPQRRDDLHVGFGVDPARQ